MVSTVLLVTTSQWLSAITTMDPRCTCARAKLTRLTTMDGMMVHLPGRKPTSTSGLLVSRCQSVSNKEGLLMYRNCSFLHKQILYALVDCALHEEYIAPSGALPNAYGCDMNKHRQQKSQIKSIEQVEYIGCHHFHQSALTSVLERECFNLHSTLLWLLIPFHNHW